jgi:hypothetical protein
VYGREYFFGRGIDWMEDTQPLHDMRPVAVRQIGSTAVTPEQFGAFLLQIHVRPDVDVFMTTTMMMMMCAPLYVSRWC